MHSDPLGAFINELKNAQAAGKPHMVTGYAKLQHALAEKLVERGFLKSAAKKTKKNKPVLEVELAYEEVAEAGTTKKQAKIVEAKRVSTPGRRRYAGAENIHPVRQGKGVLFVSTPQGILTDEEARKAHVGGELLCEVW